MKRNALGGLGFQESFAFPMAKGAGFALDMDLAILLLPTLKSLQTALRGKGGRAREPGPRSLSEDLTIKRLKRLIKTYI